MDTKIIRITKMYDPRRPYWTNSKDMNKLIVDKQLEYCYEKFRARGFLFLNEVYQELGIPCTRQGQVSGWIFGDEYLKDCMWTVWTKNDEYADVYITFEPLSDILDALPNDENES